MKDQHDRSSDAKGSSEEKSLRRREFIQRSAAVLGAGLVMACQKPAVAPKGGPAPTVALENGMLYRTLGRTGERVSVLGPGGWHIGQPAVSEQDGVQLIRQAIDRGINFMDNCWDYNEGESEGRMGKALRNGYRQKVFLMDKIDGRTKTEAGKQIDSCLQRLQTDRIDLMQFHEIIRMEDSNRIFADGGAFEAMSEARKAGKIRYIGFTGHKDPLMHLHMLDLARQHDVHFDASLMPLNVMDVHYRSFEREVLPVLISEGIAPLGMKAFGDHSILNSNTVTAIEALHYCLNLPIAVQVTGIDSQRVLDQALEAVRTFRPFTESELAGLRERTRSAALTGRYELYKTSTRMDGTQRHPEWLGVDPLAG